MNTSINHFDFVFIYIFILNQRKRREGDPSPFISDQNVSFSFNGFPDRNVANARVFDATANNYCEACVCRVSTVDSTNLHIKLTMTTTANMHIIILWNLLFYFAQSAVLLCLCFAVCLLSNPLWEKWSKHLAAVVVAVAVAAVMANVLTLTVCRICIYSHCQAVDYTDNTIF